MTVPIVLRFKQWLAVQLGDAYAPTIMIVGRVGGTFLLAFLGKIVGGDGLSIGNLLRLSYWQTAAIAGALAVLTLLQSLITTWITGHPALLSFASNTLRRQTRLGVGLPPRPRQPVKYRRWSHRKDVRR